MNEVINKIITTSIEAVLPDKAVQKALCELELEGDIHIIAIGKAAFAMTRAASKALNNNYVGGVCITKYEHSQGEIPRIKIFEAGHPVVDENSIKATNAAIEYASHLGKEDTLLFLVSGGGSALFESPTCSLEEFKKLNEELLASGKDIVEMNKIRTQNSNVKGGKFAKICKPAKIINLILSDVLGDDLKSIASGPAISDDSEAIIIGNLSKLIDAACKACEAQGYKPVVVNEAMTGIAREEASLFAKKALGYSKSDEKVALISGGETVVKLTGSGKGGRNQEFALACAPLIEDKNITIFSVGSDGTDGPTDAAGGHVSGNSMKLFREAGIDVQTYLDNNDSYHALKETNQLIITGPTGTNVNDIAVALIN